MAINLKTISIEGLRILLPAFHTQKLFDCALQIHNYILDCNKWKDADSVGLFVKDLVRKKSILETELRTRCVTKKIHYKRMRGQKIDNYEKIRQHSEFTNFFRNWLEKNSKRIFGVK